MHNTIFRVSKYKVHVNHYLYLLLFIWVNILRQYLHLLSDGGEIKKNVNKCFAVKRKVNTFTQQCITFMRLTIWPFRIVDPKSSRSPFNNRNQILCILHLRYSIGHEKKKRMKLNPCDMFNHTEEKNLVK